MVGKVRYLRYEVWPPSGPLDPWTLNPNWTLAAFCTLQHNINRYSIIDIYSLGHPRPAFSFSCFNTYLTLVTYVHSKSSKDKKGKKGGLGISTIH